MKVKCNKGSLLIEALLAVVIIAISLTLIIESLASSYRAVILTKDYSQALILLENQLSLLAQKGFIEDSINESDSYPEPFSKYRYDLKTSLSQKADNSFSQEDLGGINKVDLSVSWSTGRKANKVSLLTYLFEPPKDEE